MKRTWPIEHLDCPNCAAKLENALRKLPGVESVSVNFTGGTVTITATLKDDPETTAECKLEVKYAWWQHLVRIFLFGWIWY